MSIHTSRPEMEQFCARTLEVSKMAAIGEHLASCPECHQLFHKVFQKRRNQVPTAINLSQEKWLKDEHLDYEWLVAYVDDAMDSDERVMTEIHLSLCRLCSEEAEDFLRWRRESESELAIRYTPAEQASITEKVLGRWSWLGITRKPAYTFAVLLAISAAIILVISFLTLRPNGYEEQQANISPSPHVLLPATPVLNDVSTPAPIVTPTPQIRASPDTRSHQAGSKSETSSTTTLTTKLAVSLNDGERMVAIDKSGRLIGLERLPPEIQKSVKWFLLSEEISRPGALTDLAGAGGDLRGEGNQSSFKLLSPAGIVISDDHPVFRWERLSSAEGYRVYVSNSHSHKIADSGLLHPRETQWSSPLPLKRNEVYSWAVSAVVKGEEIVSPSVSEPEVKFRILSEEKMRELDLLKRNANSHLALGVFYAQAGMLSEAEREFQELIDDNPDSPIVHRLLRIVRSWR
jgi:hypothetical protein